MNHGSEPAMFVHHFLVLISFVNFCCFNFMCSHAFFFTLFERSNPSNQFEVDLDWGRGSRGGGTGPCSGDALALPSTEERWQSSKQPSSV